MKKSHKDIQWKILINGVLAPILILVFSIIFSYISSYISLELGISAKFEEVFISVFPAWIALYGIGYTICFWYLDREQNLQDKDFHNFALLEPIPFYESPFVNNDEIIEESSIEEGSNIEQVSVTSLGKVYELRKEEIFPGYSKYIDVPFSENSLHEGTPLMSIINRGKDYGVAKYVYILFKKKLNVSLDKAVYIEGNDPNYTVIEKGHMGYHFPFQNLPYISMEPNIRYKGFYDHIKRTGDDFVVVISYQSVINDKYILQAYKGHMGEVAKGPYIKRFRPMEKEDILKEIEPDFADRIIKNSAYKS